MAKGLTLRREWKRRYFVASRLESAAETIGAIRPGDEISGLTCGQFSMIDIVEHMVREAGPSDVFITTWGSGIYDVERAAVLASQGAIRSIRFMLDRMTFSKAPKYAVPMIEVFGAGAFRDASIHAKIALVASDNVRMVCRASMNLNKNLKLEQFDISACDEMYAFFSEWAERLWSAASPEGERAFQRIWDEYATTRGAAPAGPWPSAKALAKKLPPASGIGRPSKQ